MKKLINRISLICLLLSSVGGFAQWQTDVRLTNNSANSFGSRDKSIAVYGNNIHVVWQDHRDGDAEVYYKRSTNSGVTWSTDLRLSPPGDYSGTPTIALYQSAIHIFWVDQRIAPLDIFYVRSTDNGATWQPEVQLTTDIMDSQYPSVSVSGSNVYLAWEDNRHVPNKEVYFKRSTNAGLNWSSEMRLTNDTMISNDVSIASIGQNIHLAWVSGTGNSEIYYRNSTNGGINWSAEQRMTNDPAISFYPCIAVSGQNINLFWSDGRDGNYEIYFKRSTDGGAVWSNDSRLTNAANNSISPNAVAFGQLIAVVWPDLRLNFYKIYYKVSTNGGLNWSSDLLLSPMANTGSTGNSSIDISDSAAHVIWEDTRDGNPEIYYKKNIFSFPVGITPVNNETPSSYSLSQNYPNPFNPVTNIKFSIPKTGFVKLTVYDAAGRETAALFNGVLSAGTYNYDFDASRLTSGIYFYKLQSGSFVQTRKMMLIK
jgi:hypothetical protein